MTTVPPVTFIYRNHAGQIATRLVATPRFEFRFSDYHDTVGPEWFLVAHDLEKDAERDFRVEDILSRIRMV